MLYAKNFLHMKPGQLGGLDLEARFPERITAQVEKKHSKTIF